MINVRKIYLVLLNVISVSVMTFAGLFGQQTVGLFEHSEESYNGYTLFTPVSSRITYLIDNCGYKVHEWQSDYRPALSVYLQEDGSIVRTGVLQTPFVSGGTGGRVECISWEGEVKWHFHYSTDEVQQHHDIEVLPNGNVLLIAWERISADEAIALGRDPETIGASLWPDHVVEFDPNEGGSPEIVWEWHVIDHVIQDFDSEKPNYGVVADHPELIDLNYRDFPTGADWNHVNSIDYWEEEDLIVLSSRTFSELWVIDHSTTTEEARSHEGGRYGRGGDLLYRWGNPAAYDRGTSADKRFFNQHDASWIVDGPYAGQIMVYNNGVNRPGGNSSSVDRIIPPFQSGIGFEINNGEAYGPDELSWSFAGEFGTTFYSSALSGASMLPNGNVLACVGVEGRFIEITPGKEVVWEYVNPDVQGQPVEQGEDPGPNNVFKTFRYSLDHPAFEDRELRQISPIELDPIPVVCETTVSTRNKVYQDPALFKLISNPVRDVLRIENIAASFEVSLIDMNGRVVRSQNHMEGPGTNAEIDVSELLSGAYVVRGVHAASGKIQVEKLLIL